MNTKITLFTMMLAFYLSGWSQTFTGPEKEIQTLLEKIETFSQYVMDSDFEMIGNSYTPDAKILVTGRDIIEGRENIKRYWTPSGNSKTIYHKAFPEEISITSDIAYDYGKYEGTTKRPNGEEVSWKGKYVIIWKKIDGEWKIYVDIWNRTD